MPEIITQDLSQLTLKIYLQQWSFRKIGTMGTLGPKDRSSRPKGPRAGAGFLGREQRAPSLPASGSGERCNLSGVRGGVHAANAFWA